MLGGVTIVDPQTTWIDAGVTLEQDVVVHPFTVLAGVAHVARGAQIGPMAAGVDMTATGTGRNRRWRVDAFTPRQFYSK